MSSLKFRLSRLVSNTDVPGKYLVLVIRVRSFDLVNDAIQPISEPLYFQATGPLRLGEVALTAEN